MLIIKRNGSEATFDITKIIAAVTKANEVVEESERMTPMQIKRIAQSVELTCLEMTWDGLKILWQQEYYYQREDYVDPKEGTWIWLEAYSVHDTSILN